MGAFDLSKKDGEERDKYAKDLRELAERVEEAVNTYNEEVGKLRENVNGAIADYNRVLEEATAFVNGIAETARGTFDDRSEKWQESEAGEQAAAWLDEWEGFEGDEVEADDPDTLAYPDMDHADRLEGLPTDSES